MGVRRTPKAPRVCLAKWWHGCADIAPELTSQHLRQIGVDQVAGLVQSSGIPFRDIRSLTDAVRHDAQTCRYCVAIWIRQNFSCELPSCFPSKHLQEPPSRLAFRIFCRYSCRNEVCRGLGALT